MNKGRLLIATATGSLIYDNVRNWGCLFSEVLQHAIKGYSESQDIKQHVERERYSKSKIMVINQKQRMWLCGFILVNKVFATLFSALCWKLKP